MLKKIAVGLDRCREAGLAGLLHDVGKALMPFEVLNKPGKLTDAEFELMRSHPARGHALLVEGAGAEAMDACLHHHERIDGSGYPHRLAGEAISQIARMGAICGVHDAVSSTRLYEAARDPADATARMASSTGHFDATLFSVFVRSLGICPTGSLLRLHSGRLAVVVEQNTHELTAPVVEVFFSTSSNMPIPVTRIDLSRRDVSDRVVGREPRGDWKLSQLDALWAGDAARA